MSELIFYARRISILTLTIFFGIVFLLKITTEFNLGVIFVISALIVGMFIFAYCLSKNKDKIIRNVCLVSLLALATSVISVASLNGFVFILMLIILWVFVIPTVNITFYGDNIRPEQIPTLQATLKILSIQGLFIFFIVIVVGLILI